jgi:hypothetical protein
MVFGPRVSRVYLIYQKIYVSFQDLSASNVTRYVHRKEPGPVLACLDRVGSISKPKKLRYQDLEAIARNLAGVTLALSNYLPVASRH